MSCQHDNIVAMWSHTTYCNHAYVLMYVQLYFLYREVTVAFLFCARACISGASQILYVYTAEVYPTEVRGLGLGIAAAVGSGGSVIMPYIAQVRMQFIRHFLYIRRSGSANHVH